MTPQPFTFLNFSEAALRTRLVFVSSVERLSTLTAHASICSGQQCKLSLTQSTRVLAVQGKLCPDLLNLGRNVSAQLDPIHLCKKRLLRPRTTAAAGWTHYRACLRETSVGLVLRTSLRVILQRCLTSCSIHSRLTSLQKMQGATDRSVKMSLMFSHHQSVFSLRISHITLLKALEVSLQAVQFRMNIIGYGCEDCIRRSISTQGSVICFEGVMRKFSAVKRRQRPVR